MAERIVMVGGATDYAAMEIHTMARRVRGTIVIEIVREELPITAPAIDYVAPTLLAPTKKVAPWGKRARFGKKGKP